MGCSLNYFPSSTGGWRKGRGSLGLTSLDKFSVLSDVYKTELEFQTWRFAQLHILSGLCFLW